MDLKEQFEVLALSLDKLSTDVEAEQKRITNINQALLQIISCIKGIAAKGILARRLPQHYLKEIEATAQKAIETYAKRKVN